MPPAHDPAAGPFAFPVRVYYEDTDAAGVVYYASYLRFLERGRTEWLRALGFEQQRLAQDAGVVFVVRSLNIEYLKPARLDERLAVLTAPAAAGRAQITLKQRIERDGEILVEATVRVACLDAVKMKPAALPAPLKNKMEAR
ncbi:MAG TPA: tol-pal system-associated acyl-CoA thioesterase [Candidatus Desulfobacillus sp.]|nr:tol-pal system-associated acyl-CoA thioesterase [Candidatus Desulfobacillus sp.]